VLSYFWLCRAVDFALRSGLRISYPANWCEGLPHHSTEAAGNPARTVREEMAAQVAAANAEIEGSDEPDDED
jgi:hypothetical protein